MDAKTQLVAGLLQLDLPKGVHLMDVRREMLGGIWGWWFQWSVRAVYVFDFRFDERDVASRVSADPELASIRERLAEMAGRLDRSTSGTKPQESAEQRRAREQTDRDLADYYEGKGQKFYGMP